MDILCSSRTVQSQFPFKYDICVFIVYALFQANPIISTNSVDFATSFSSVGEPLYDDGHTFA